MRKSSAGCAALLLLLTLFSSCLNTVNRRPGPASRSGPALPPAAAAIQRKLTEGARYVLGRRELVVRGRRFPYDCTGTVLAIYWYAGIDLARDFIKYDGNGVNRLFRTLEKEQLLYSDAFPVAGDIVFWDNTYDRNGDGLWNDPLTHVGMVVKAEADGSIEYVHLNNTRGIVIEHMNLLQPDLHQRLVRGQARIFNSPIRLKEAGRPHPPQWLAGQLYRVLGMGYLF
jgi:hypothetical protein